MDYIIYAVCCAGFAKKESGGDSAYVPLLYADTVLRAACDNPVCTAGIGGGTVYDLRGVGSEQSITLGLSKA